MDRENLIIYIMMLGTFGVLSTEMGVVGICLKLQNILMRQSLKQVYL